MAAPYDLPGRGAAWVVPAKPFSVHIAVRDCGAFRFSITHAREASFFN